MRNVPQYLSTVLWLILLGSILTGINELDTGWPNRDTSVAIILRLHLTPWHQGAGRTCSDSMGRGKRIVGILVHRLLAGCSCLLNLVFQFLADSLLKASILSFTR